jgi:1-acyl-sn-glycerol-3-phosphate acyltransferase
MTNIVAPAEPIHEPGWLSPTGLEIFRWLLKTLFDILAPMKAYGKENFALLGSGGFVIAANHTSYFDAPLMYVHIPPHRKLTAFGADKYRHSGLFSFILRMVGVIWVNRDAPSPATIKAAVQVLRSGTILGVAPEGTRNRDTHALQEGKTGAAYLAVTAGVPVLPVGIAHTAQVTNDLKHLRRSYVSITFGKPLYFPAPARQERDAKLEEYTTELMCQIAALLPEEYRGFYTDHPRLQQLLKENAPAEAAQPRPAVTALQGE